MTLLILFYILILIAGVILLAASAFSIGAVVFFILLLLVGVPILVKSILRMITSMISRVCLVHRLKNWADRNGYEVTKHHAAVSSFFKTYSGADITLARRQKTYYIKFFPHFSKSKAIHLISSEHALFCTNIALFAQRTAGTPIILTLTSFKKKINTEFNSQEGECIMIFSPSPYKITCLRGNTQERIDNGYSYENRFIFYHHGRILDYLDRTINS